MSGYSIGWGMPVIAIALLTIGMVAIHGPALGAVHALAATIGAVIGTLIVTRCR